MNRILLIGILLSLGFSAYLFLTIKPSTGLIHYALEEGEAKKQWELEMLRDPSTGKIPDGIRWKELAFYEENFNHHTQNKNEHWRLRGPWNVGGRTRAICMDVKDENHIIIGSVSGGLWQTFDGGNTWTKVSKANDHPGVVSICQDTRPGYEQIWYALSGEIAGTSASAAGAFYLGDGVFRSLDNGNTWQSLASTALGVPSTFSTVFQGAWRIKCNPINGDVFMACYATIFRSVDSGNSWVAVLGNNNDSYYTDIEISEQGIIYAAISHYDFTGINTSGFFRSPDGQTFTKISPSYLDSTNRTVLCIDPNNENTVYFLSEINGANNGGVRTENYQHEAEYVSLQKYQYLSGDGSGTGGQWTNLSNNLPVNSEGEFDKFNCQGGYDLCIKVQPGNSDVVIIGGTNLYRSTDGFNSINNTSQIGGYGLKTSIPFFTIYPNHHPDQHDVLFVPSQPNKMYSISDGGIKLTNNVMAQNVSWENKSEGYVSSQCYTVNIDENNAGNERIMIGLQDNGNFVSFTNNLYQPWLMPVNGDGAFGYISSNNNFFVTSIQLGRIVKIALDERGNLSQRRRIDPIGFSTNHYSFIHPFIVDPNNENYLYLPIGKQILRQSELKNIALNNEYSQISQGWKNLSDTITTANFSGSAAKITAIALSKSPANIMYFGTSNKEIYKVINPQTDTAHFIRTSIGRLPTGGYVNDIAIDPDDANKVLICYSNYTIMSLYYTEDGGNNWYFVGGNLERDDNPSGTGPSVRSVAILKNPDGSRTYLAGTSIGLFSCSNLVLATNASTLINNTEWIQESPNVIGANVVSDIKVRHSDGYVAIATHGNGVFETMYHSNQSITPSPQQYFSASLYPNPAQHNLNYSFTLENESEVFVELMDVWGNRLKILRDEKYLAGTFYYSLNVDDLSSGMYFLFINNKSEKTKSILKFLVQH